MDTYSWDFGSAAEGLQFTITYDKVANEFTVKVISGSMDLNALWFADKDGTSDG